MDPSPLTDAQHQRAEAALLPFIQQWNLPMNPEETDELIYALFSHVGPRDAPDGEDELQRIMDNVNQQLQVYQRRCAELLQAQQASIDRRYGNSSIEDYREKP